MYVECKHIYTNFGDFRASDDVSFGIEKITRYTRETTAGSEFKALGVTALYMSDAEGVAVLGNASTKYGMAFVGNAGSDELVWRSAEDGGWSTTSKEVKNVSNETKTVGGYQLIGYQTEAEIAVKAALKVGNMTIVNSVATVYPVPST